jgi:hypothetical protein
MAPDHFKTLDTFWSTLQTLKPDSPDAEWDKLAAFVHPEAVMYTMGMNAPPNRSRAEALAAFKGLVGYWKLVERRVVASGLSADGKTAFNEMKNHITILGETLDHYPETEIVQFDDDGLIVSYRLYLDPSSAMKIFAEKGVGI